jgi:hypothetical protein
MDADAEKITIYIYICVCTFTTSFYTKTPIRVPTSNKGYFSAIVCGVCTHTVYVTFNVMFRARTVHCCFSIWWKLYLNLMLRWSSRGLHNSYDILFYYIARARLSRTILYWNENEPTVMENGTYNILRTPVPGNTYPTSSKRTSFVTRSRNNNGVWIRIHFANWYLLLMVSICTDFVLERRKKNHAKIKRTRRWL